MTERAVGEIRYELDETPRHLTIYEYHPPWREGIGPEWSRVPAARLRYTATRGEWSLYWTDRNREFHEYGVTSPTGMVGRLLVEIAHDPSNIFWG